MVRVRVWRVEEQEKGRVAVVAMPLSRGAAALLPTSDSVGRREEKRRR